MANNGTLENAISDLNARVGDLAASIENEMPDLEAVAGHLNYISERAENLRVAAVEMNVTLEKL